MLRCREGSNLRVALLVSIALLLPRPAIGDNTDSQNLERFIARATELADTGHIQQAIRLLRDRIPNETDPSRQLALRGALGDTYLLLGDLDAALGEYDAILSDWPLLGLAHFKRGRVLERRIESLPESIESYERSIQLGYTKPPVYTRLGFSYKTLSEAQDRDEAERAKFRQRAAYYYDQAIAQDATDISALGNLADLHAEFGSPQRALSLYARLTGMRPTDPIVHARLGALLIKLDQPDPARDALQRAALLASEQRPSVPEMRAHVLRDTEAATRLKLADLMLAADEQAAAQRELELVRELATCSRCKFRSEALQASGQAAAERLTELAANTSTPAAPE